MKAVRHRRRCSIVFSVFCMRKKQTGTAERYELVTVRPTGLPPRGRTALHDDARAARTPGMASFGASKPSPYKTTGAARALRERFDEYSVFGGTNAGVGLSAKNFAKLCADSGLVDRKLSRTQLDLIFMRSVDRGAKKLKWMQFLQALELCAATRRIGVEKVQELIMACAGPSLNRPSVSEPVRLHDDKALYTGVHVVGGPSTVDNKVTLDRLVRSPHADVRGVDHSKHYSDAEAGVSSGHHVGLSPSRSMPTPPRPARTPPVTLAPRSPVVPPPVEHAVPPPPPDYFDALTRCGVPRRHQYSARTTRHRMVWGIKLANAVAGTSSAIIRPRRPTSEAC